MDQIIATFNYISQAPFFWMGMGFTTAIAMFVGAIIFDGNLPQASKGLVSVGSYAAMLFWLNSARVTDTINDRAAQGIKTLHPEMVWAGIMTLLLVTLAWVLGVFLGVFIVSRKHKDYERR